MIVKMAVTGCNFDAIQGEEFYGLQSYGDSACALYDLDKPQLNETI